MTDEKVVIVGAGIAGLTAAHELALRGFEVTLYEMKSYAGGLAASQEQPLQDKNGATLKDDNGNDLMFYGEHGFRLFPAFYYHMQDTMRRIPLRDKNDPDARPSGRTVMDNLVPTRIQGAAFSDDTVPGAVTYSSAPAKSVETVMRGLSSLLNQMRLPPTDIMRFQLKMLQHMTSCGERRLQEYESQTWWEYLEGDTYSDRFKKYLNTIPRTLVAMDARHSDARTQSNVLVQHMIEQNRSGINVDQVLTGPTTHKLIEPWLKHLECLGVKPIQYEHRLAKLEIDAAQNLTGLEFIKGDNPGVPIKLQYGVDFDYAILALPIEIAQKLTKQLVNSELGGDENLLLDEELKKVFEYPIKEANQDLTGMQFFLEQDAQLVPGHVFLPDSEWGISMVSQAQFWGDDFAREWGHNRFRGVLSVDIGDMGTPADIGGGVMKTAEKCTTRQELADGVWLQIKNAVPDLDDYYGRIELEQLVIRRGKLPKDTPEHFLIDSGLEFTGFGIKNRTPMLTTIPGSYAKRPGPMLGKGYDLVLGDRVLFAGNYTQTYMNLPTMEGANESARHAVDAILDHIGWEGERCPLMPLAGSEPRDLDYFKALDRELLNRGLPHFMEILEYDQLMKWIMPSTTANKAIDLDTLLPKSLKDLANCRPEPKGAKVPKSGKPQPPGPVDHDHPRSRDHAEDIQERARRGGFGDPLSGLVGLLGGFR